MLAKEIQEIIKVFTGASEIDRIEVKTVDEGEIEVTVEYRTRSLIGTLFGRKRKVKTRTFSVKEKDKGE